MASFFTAIALVRLDATALADRAWWGWGQDRRGCSVGVPEDAGVAQSSVYKMRMPLQLSC